MTRPMWISLTGLVLAATLFGVVIGLRAVPPTEGEIIDSLAALYVAETGGSPTDCHAVPSELNGVRLVLICMPQGGETRLYPVNDWGVMVELDASLTAGEPQT